MRPALLAVPLLAGCLIGESGDDGLDLSHGDSGEPATLAATWAVTELATGERLGCPAGFGITAVLAQRLDDAGQLDGKATRKTFDCAAGEGTLSLPRGTYDVWVEIQDEARAVAMRSPVRRVALSAGEVAPHIATLFPDAGYFGFAWQLRDGATKQLVPCGERVVAIEAVVTTASATLVDRFDCEAGRGVTGAILPGTHALQLTAIGPDGQRLATAQPAMQEIRAGNSVTSLGTITIPLPR